VIGRIKVCMTEPVADDRHVDACTCNVASLEPLRERHTFLHHLAPTRETEWVVYTKRPFAGPEQVLDYVGRYTHRVAISNNRLLDIDNEKVTFRYKDYRHDSQQKTMTLCSIP